MGQSVYGGTGDQSTYGNTGTTYTASGQTNTGNSNNSQDPYQTIATYQQYLADIQKALAASSGWEREKLEAQRQDAQRALDNAYKIAKLQSDTQRYGYDQQRQTDLDKLKEDQRQYDSTHELDLKKYGLQVAEDYTKFANTADQVWVANDFKSALSRVGQGLNTGSSATEPEAHAKTWEDFAALSGYSDNPVVASKTQTTGGGTSSGGYSTQSTGGTDTSSGQTTTSGTDARNTAINAVTKAIPASDSEGHDDQDWAALNAIKSLYFAGKPGAVNKLGAARTKIARAGLTRLGYDADTVTEDNQRAGIGQGSTRAA